MVTLKKRVVKCFKFGKNGRVAKKCWSKTNDKNENEKHKKKSCFVCNKERHIARDCLSKEKKDEQPETAMLTVSKTAVSGTFN